MSTRFPVKLPSRDDIMTIYLVQVPARPPSQDRNMADACASSHMQPSGLSSQLEQWENTSWLDMDLGFLGFDFFNEWQQTEHLDFSG